MSTNEKFMAAATKLAIVLRCPNKGDLKFKLNDNGALECKLVMRNDTDKLLSCNSKSVYWRNINEHGKQIGYREFGSVDHFARSLA